MSIENQIKKLFEDVRSALHVQAIQEKDKQNKTADDLFSSVEKDVKSKEQDSDEQTSDKSQDKKDSGEAQKEKMQADSDDDNDKLATADIETPDIIEKINSIRSGKSFKDATVADHMEKYVNSLDAAEKTALLAFLKAIGEIVVADQQATTDPSAAPAEVAMKKDEPKGKEVHHIKPNVITKQIKQEKPEGSQKGLEDTTPPQKLPISVKAKK